MLAMTLLAAVNCDHQSGIVANLASQKWVTVEGVPVLVATDPEGRPIAGCPNLNPITGQKPCLTTLKVQRGYSALSKIGGKKVCLQTVTGFTDGTPPGVFKYSVRAPGQAFVRFAQ